MRLAPLALLVFALVVPALVVPATALHAQEVGEVGVTARLEAVGNQTIPTADIRRALLGDLDWLLASHPRAPLDRLLVIVSERVGAGYQSSGFPHTAVTARIAAGHLRLDVIEGKRFRCGTVVVEGAQVIPSAKLVAWLTTAHPKPETWTALKSTDGSAAKLAEAAEKREHKTPGSELEDPLWRAGQYADFHRSFADLVTGQVLSCYTQAGRLAAAASARLDEHPDGTADMRVTISDEGVIAHLAEATFTGLVKTPRDEIERLLGIVPDMVIGPDTAARMEARLNDCGRFRFQQVALEPTADRSRFRLAVTVHESGNIPPLPMPLSPVAEALLAGRSWLQHTLESGAEDLVLSVGKADATYDLVLSPQRGVLLTYDATTPDGIRRHGGLLLADDAYAFVCGNARRGVRGVTKLNFGLTVSLTSAEKAERRNPNNRDPGSLSFLLPFDDPGKSAPVFKTLVTLVPATLLTMAYGDDMQWHLRDRRLSLPDAPADGLAIDAATGRMLPVDRTDDKGFHQHLEFVPGAFAKQRAKFSAQYAGLAWTEAPETPLSAITGIAIGELQDLLPLVPTSEPKDAANLAEIRDTLVLMDSMLSDRLLPTGERWLRSLLAGLSLHDGKEDFTIPAAAAMPRQNLQAVAAFMLARISGALAADLPADSWPLVLLRGAAGVLIGNTALINQDLQLLTGDDGCGPLGCLALSGTLRLINPGGARYFAKLGGERLGDAHLLRDARLFRPWAGQILAQLAELPAEAKLWDRLPADQRTAIRDLLTTLRQPLGDAAAQAKRYDDACRILWANGLRQRVAGWLTALAADDNAAPIP